MKSFIFLFISILILGCSNKEISEKEFNIVWREYIQREFVESFDEEQSTSQREKILNEVLKKYSIDLEDYKNYMMKRHKDKYKKIFLE